MWLRREGAIEVYLLRGGDYERAQRSELLPELDLALMTRCLLEAPSQTAAVRTFLAALRGG